jgi:2-methylisocitrate lyase-like PEP mutase family enzyme
MLGDLCVFAVHSPAEELTMKLTPEEKRAAFRALHAQGIFVLPNPWDIGSARLFQHLGFQALASTSSGFAWSVGRADYASSRDEVIEHLAALSQAVDLPLNADLEGGFAAEPEGVAETVRLAVAAGVAGLSIEDTRLDSSGLYDLAFSVERIAAARSAIDHSGADVVLVARTEGLLREPSALTPAIDKLVAFAAAGADCLYAPGMREPEDIATLVRAVAPRPVNVLMHRPGLSVAQLADLGVRRVSVGGALARVAWGAVMAACEQLRAGSFDGLSNAASGADLNRIFATLA